MSGDDSYHLVVISHKLTEATPDGFTPDELSCHYVAVIIN